MQNGRVDMTSATTGADAGPGQRADHGRTPTPAGPAAAPSGPTDPQDTGGRCWDDRSRDRTAVAAGGLLAAVVGICAATWYGTAATLWLGVVAVVAAAGGTALTAVPRQRAAGTALLLCGTALGVLAAWQATAAGSPARPRSRWQWPAGNCCWP